MTLASARVEEVLLLLKIAFLVLLYLFIWRIVRTATRDLRLPQESFVIGPGAAVAGAGPSAAGPTTGRLVVLKSPALREGEAHTLDSMALTLGRGSQNDIGLGSDTYASARHARVEPRMDGVWVEDLGSSNGTYVNGAKLTRPRKLASGDVLRVGQTDLRFEA